MTGSKDISALAWALLGALAFIWGGSFLAIRIALNEVPVLTSVAHRAIWAMLVLWLYVWARGLPVPKSARVWVGFLVMGLLNNVIPFSLIAWGQLSIETGLTSILNASTAVFGTVTAAIAFSDERLTVRKTIGVSLGFLGVATAIGLDHLTRFDPRSLAQLAILAGTISYACAGIWARKRLSDLAPAVAAAGMLTGSSLIILPAALIIDGPIDFSLAPVTWLAIAYYAMISTALAFLLYYRILALAGSANLMLVTMLIPPVAIVLGAAVLGESLHPRAYAGFAILALGLIVLDGRAARRITRRR